MKLARRLIEGDDGLPAEEVGIARVIKIRGNPHQIFERYVALAREASTSGDRVAAENLYQHAVHYFRIMNAANKGHPHRATRPVAPADVETEMAEEEGSGRCAPHQAIGSLIPPDVCFGAGCPPEGLISRRLSSPCYGGPANRLRVQLFESLFGSTRLTTLEFLCAAQFRLIPQRRTDYNQNCAAQQLFYKHKFPR